MTAADGSPLIKRILGLFLEHAPNQLSALQETSHAGADLKSLAEAAHSLKSVCSSIGATPAAEACHAMEEAARTGTLTDPAAYLSDISREIARALKAATAMHQAA